MFNRHVSKLEAAIYVLDHDYTRSPIRFTRTIELAIRSAVRASLPGRQKKANLDPIVKNATKAFIRTLRRRGKK